MNNHYSVPNDSSFVFSTKGKTGLISKTHKFLSHGSKLEVVSDTQKQKLCGKINKIVKHLRKIEHEIIVSTNKLLSCIQSESLKAIKLIIYEREKYKSLYQFTMENNLIDIEEKQFLKDFSITTEETSVIDTNLLESIIKEAFLLEIFSSKIQESKIFENKETPGQTDANILLSINMLPSQVSPTIYNPPQLLDINKSSYSVHDGTYFYYSW